MESSKIREQLDIISKQLIELRENSKSIVSASNILYVSKEIKQSNGDVLEETSKPPSCLIDEIVNISESLRFSNLILSTARDSFRQSIGQE